MRRMIVRLTVAVVTLFVMAFTLWFVLMATKQPVEIHACEDATGTMSNPGHLKSFPDCIEWRAEVFRTYDYPDKKSSLESLLTVLISIFVASVTFAEKLRSGRKTVLVSAWATLLFAILLCGAALVLYSQTASRSWYAPYTFYWELASIAKIFGFSSCIAFVFAMVLLLIAGNSVLTASNDIGGSPRTPNESDLAAGAPPSV